MAAAPARAHRHATGSGRCGVRPVDVEREAPDDIDDIDDIDADHQGRGADDARTDDEWRCAMKALALLPLLSLLGAATANAAPAVKPAATATAATTTAATTTAATTPTGGGDEFRRTQPGAGAPATFKVPVPQKFTASGLEVLLVERHDIPIASATVAWPTGSIDDPREKAGLASVCAATLGEGPARLPRVAFDEAQADLAAAIGIGAGAEQTSASVRALASTFPQALSLLVEMVARPGLRADDFARVQSRTVAAIVQRKGNADGIAQRLSGRVWWGEGHPFGAVASEASVNALSLDDCAGFARRLGPQGARLVVVGDVTRAGLTKLVASLVATHGWKGKAPAVRTPGAPLVKAGGIVVVDVPGAAQSMVTVLGEGPARTASEYEAQSVMFAILGGGFSSRVNMNLREKHGYTYGARAGVAYTRTRGVFSMTSSVRTDVTGPAIRELVAELRTMQGGAVTDVELSREREGALQAFPAAFATSGAVADAWSLVSFHRLPENTWEKTPQRLAAVDAATIARAARSALPRNQTLFVVGDLAKIGAELQAIAADGLFGTRADGTALVRLDADGNVVKAP
jgi:zinc protease